MFRSISSRMFPRYFLFCLVLLGGSAGMDCGLCTLSADKCGLAPLFEDDDNSGLILFALPSVLQFNPAGVRAAQALSAWQIGLQTNLVGFSRVEGAGAVASDPPNWITWADEGCGVTGVSSTLQASCPFSSAGVIVGVCFVTSFNSSGEILETTAILSRSYQEGSAAESRKLAVVIHEIGHCLGLKHTSSTSNIMFSTVTDTTGPSAVEFAAINDAYVPIQEPSTANRDAYYEVTAGNKPKRHFTFPTLTISSALTSASGFSSAKTPMSTGRSGFDERGPTTTTAHYIRSDGGCETRRVGH